MLHVLQQQTAPADPSAADVAAQIRTQVLQQLKDAGVAAQKARSEADRAAQTTIKHGGKTIVIESP
jgi:hypothetical protein